jgi:hypothetical protein
VLAYGAYLWRGMRSVYGESRAHTTLKFVPLILLVYLSVVLMPALLYVVLGWF